MPRLVSPRVRPLAAAARTLLVAALASAPLVVPALTPTAAAQAVATRYAFTSEIGRRVTAGLQTVSGGAKQVVLTFDDGLVMRLPTRFTRGTTISGFRYRTTGMDEWLSFQARDARYVTQYRWYFADGLLTFEATDRRTNRVRRGRQDVDG